MGGGSVGFENLEGFWCRGCGAAVVIDGAFLIFFDFRVYSSLVRAADRTVLCCNRKCNEHVEPGLYICFP